MEPMWPYGLDVAALTASGWRPSPLRTFVYKIHSRCDLACAYCYMYESVDQSWRDQPPRMDSETIDRAARRVGEHARRHRLDQVGVIFHGGEPLLAGLDLIGEAVASVRREVGPGVLTRFGVQTNGRMLTAAMTAGLAGLGVRVGVSVDGTAEAHDRHRRGKDGGGSHAVVRRNLLRLRDGEHAAIFNGVLCTVDLRNDPLETYEALLEFAPPSVDFLLPHANWSAPPPGAGPGTPYADWLLRVFARWYDAPVRETRVRSFEEILRLLLGRPARLESLGSAPLRYLVIETDGSFRQSDALKTAYAGAADLVGNVHTHPIDAALAQPPMVARQLGVTGLAPECRHCPVVSVCGGGHYAHRYHPDTGFLNPTVYCRDLYALIQGIRLRLEADVSALRDTAS
ncbi:FxsB family radical SAM/SPASM domain protein [Actinocorallia sp. API 0066]|uniref:FxsB family cyclophane-forming radical SAM/SPASM peptide maturase n=1 Tax=Actinocorallia sp. API 0066 TaxID=2896846 RepID=UPI001E50759E|nr:FxsB family cyclophane-forming radical SAM/SPASM peptide maturase [Actinocorallia sp. API 0066]MCD0453147.1 FxsB family radical SAM/SPASM domain protein [Actinocorallia sp. API 0066]